MKRVRECPAKRLGGSTASRCSTRQFRPLKTNVSYSGRYVRIKASVPGAVNTTKTVIVVYRVRRGLFTRRRSRGAVLERHRRRVGRAHPPGRGGGHRARRRRSRRCSGHRLHGVSRHRRHGLRRAARRQCPHLPHDAAAAPSRGPDDCGRLARRARWGDRPPGAPPSGSSRTTGRSACPSWPSPWDCCAWRSYGRDPGTAPLDQARVRASGRPGSGGGRRAGERARASERRRRHDRGPGGARLHADRARHAGGRRARFPVSPPQADPGRSRDPAVRAVRARQALRHGLALERCASSPRSVRTTTMSSRPSETSCTGPW